MKLSVKGMAFAMAIMWSLSILVTGFTAMHGWGGMFVEVMGSLYKGYDATPKGACIGAAWAFGDGLVGGAVLAFLYNMFAGCCHKE